MEFEEEHSIVMTRKEKNAKEAVAVSGGNGIQNDDGDNTVSARQGKQ